MRINEIQGQVASQHAAMRAFPSQGPSIEQMYSGQNQVAMLEVQIEFSKLLREQQREMANMTDVLGAMSAKLNLHQLESKEREKTEALRYLEMMRLTRIAAWSGMIGVLLAGLGVVAQIFIR